MALKIVTGGTTGAADGTLVSSSNKIVFTAIDTVVDAHIRADDDTYSADASFTMPAEVQVSFDGGSTWKAIGTNPNSYGVDIGDLNVAIKLRQHSTASSSTGTFQTDATTPAATALSDVTSFAVGTPVTDATLDLSWAAVTNRTRYQVDRATNSGFTTGVTLGVYTGTGTSFSDSGLTNGTTYYYRIKAIGTTRYKDSANYATANGLATHFVTTVTLPGTPGTTASFTVPAGVTSLAIECWGAGGSGGGSNLPHSGANAGAGGGGGGGAYSKKNTLAVSPGDVISYRVGAGGAAITQPASNVANSANGNAGGDSWFKSTADVLAKGGSAGAYGPGTSFTGGVGGNGGAAASGVGDTKYSGGKGGTGYYVWNLSPTDPRGAGGGGAGSGGAGGDASGTDTALAGTAGAGSGGGRGGDGRTTGQKDGVAAGGGGAAPWPDVSYVGGKGADGMIKVTY